MSRPVAGPTAMRDQLTRIIEISTLPNVTLQLIPFDVGAHPAMDTSFIILEFNEPVPPMVYAEGWPGYFYMKKPADVLRSQRMFEILSATSLSEEDSVQFIKRIIRD
jgi:Domain of unknown function (DUF5753)